jgi:Tfp pilus assembly protein PilN
MKADKDITPRVASLMKNQLQVEALYARQNELTGVLQKHIPKLPLLIMLNEVLPENTLIAQLVTAGNTVELKGMTPKSTALLEALSARPAIQNARYTAPIRQDQSSSREVFTLSFIYNPAENTTP